MKKNNFPVTPGLGIENTLTSLKFIQEGMIDRFEALMKGISKSFASVIILDGCAYNKTGDDYTVAAGSVYYNGEILSVDAFSGNHNTQVPVFGAVVYDYTGQNKPIYSDRVFRDTHGERELTVVMGVSGSGIMDVVNAPTLADVLVDICQNNLGAILFRAMIGSYTTNDVIKLYGCVVSFTGTYAITAGAIFYNDKVYKVAAQSGVATTGGETAVFKINTNVTPNTIYLDGDISGSGIADYDDSNVKTIQQIYIGSSTSITFQNSYTQIANPTSYRKDVFGNVQLNGNVLSPGSVSSSQFMQLPTGYRPTNEKTFAVAPTGGVSQEMYVITVATNGTTTVRKIDGSNVPASIRFSLDQVRFNIYD